MKLCTIVGARPQFIKAAAVSRVVKQTPQISEFIVHTGQHYDSNMSDTFFEELAIPEPSYNLSIGSSTHGRQTGLMLAAIEDVLIEEKPDWVLVYGDTNSTLAGALAAAKLCIPIAHVEAGLRSFNRAMPEEINRITADHLSTALFTPTIHSQQQLLKEGVPIERIFNVGDVMYDTTLFYNEYNTNRETIVNKLNLGTKSYVLATIHRAENTDNETRLKHICEALSELGRELKVVLPLHPRTRAILTKSGSLASLEKYVQVIDPVGYLDMLALEKEAKLIVTDSGGVQKEAYFNQVSCITLRDETEWVELVDAGWNQLCSPNASFSLLPLLSNNRECNIKSTLYGDGSASQKIVDTLLGWK